MISEAAQALGFYDYLRKLEAEYQKATNDITLYPLVILEALIGEIHTTKKTIRLWEGYDDSTRAHG